MSKQVKQQRISKAGNGMSIEQIVAQDDSLLPAPAELAAFKDVDANIIPWMLEQTKKEQEHRHKTDNDKIKLMNRAVTNDRIFIVFYLLLILLFVCLSALFVYLEKNISGSIFGVCGIIGAVVLYKRFIAVK